MSSTEHRITSASRTVHATPDRIFELIADPTRQPEWDGNGNLASATGASRVTAVGDMFAMTLTMGAVRENHVVEFVEGRRIAWQPAEPGQPPVGHLWRWEIEPAANDGSLVTHTYDWTDLRDENRFEKARSTTSDKLAASLDRLAALAENAAT